jgi:hypothetical protein
MVMIEFIAVMTLVCSLSYFATYHGWHNWVQMKNYGCMKSVVDETTVDRRPYFTITNAHKLKLSNMCIVSVS